MIDARPLVVAGDAGPIPAAGRAPGLPGMGRYEEQDARWSAARGQRAVGASQDLDAVRGDAGEDGPTRVGVADVRAARSVLAGPAQLEVVGSATSRLVHRANVGDQWSSTVDGGGEEAPQGVAQRTQVGQELAGGEPPGSVKELVVDRQPRAELRRRRVRVDDAAVGHVNRAGQLDGERLIRPHDVPLDRLHGCNGNGASIH